MGVGERMHAGTYRVAEAQPGGREPRRGSARGGGAGARADGPVRCGDQTRDERSPRV